MAFSVREQVLAALVTLLEGLEGADGIYNLRVERNRDAPVTHYPTLVVYDSDQSAETDTHGYTRYLMQVEIEGYVKIEADEGDTNVGTKMNAMYAKLVETLNSDRTLGGKCVDVNELDTEFVPNMGEGQAPAGGFRLALAVEYWTAEGDPFTSGPA